MSALALADALQDFATSRPLSSAEDALEELKAAAAPADREAEQRRAVEEAVARAEAALADRLQQEHEQALAAERARHAEEMEAVLKRSGEEAGAVIAERLAEIEQEVSALTGALAARILGVFLTEDLQQRAVEELGRVVKAAIADREAVRIRISGTALMCDALKARLGKHAQQVDFVESSGFDLSAQIDESLFETRIAEWSDTLAGVLS